MTICVLLIEDDEIANIYNRRLLKELGYIFTIARTGKGALKLLKQQKYDIIFCDLGLPDMTGFEVARRMLRQKGLNKNTPICALTVHGADEYRKRALLSGMISFLKKPLHEKDCVATVKEILKIYH